MREHVRTFKAATSRRNPNQKRPPFPKAAGIDLVSSTVQRLAQGQEKFAPDAGVGERPFGVGGKLNGHAPVGDGDDRRIALFALRSGVGFVREMEATVRQFAAAVREIFRAAGGFDSTVPGSRRFDQSRLNRASNHGRVTPHGKNSPGDVASPD